MEKKAEKIKKPQISPTGNKDTAGFTLIEILAALLMLAVIAGLILPEMYRSTRSMESKVAVRQIERDLTRVYQEAKGTGMAIKAVFCPGAEDYQIIIGDQTLERPLYGLKYEADGEAQLTFGPGGKVDGADTISFKDDLGKDYIWKAEPLRGQ